MTTPLAQLERNLWAAADHLRANSNLAPKQYSTPVLGLIFLRYAEHRFNQVGRELAATATGRRTPGKDDYQARGAIYLPEAARFSSLLALPDDADLGRAINNAMRLIEDDNPDLKGVLPRAYATLDRDTLAALMRVMSSIPTSIEGDAFGKIYEYFLGEFARTEGQRGGEFFTPTAIVRLIVEIIEPFHGRIFDPACGSGGMFVQSARFVENHHKNPSREISIHGQEKVDETVRLGKVNLAVHGLTGDIRQANSYYEDPFRQAGRFDFVMANPPFNVNAVDKERLAGERRFPFGLPRTDNANYLWIQMFYSALAERGRAGFVMANSAADARSSEQEIRRQLVESGAVDVMVSIGPNFFYTVTLPCTLWFLDRGKAGTPRADKVLFLDARSIFTQVDRAHREFTPQQIELLANVVRLYRGEQPEDREGSAGLLKEHFPSGAYQDIPGLCKVATRAEIEAQGWSLNPGRYVGVAGRPADDIDFAVRLEELNEELELLNGQAHDLEERISENVARLLEVRQ